MSDSADLSAWVPPPLPSHTAMQNAHAELAPLAPSQFPQLWQAFAGRPDLWDYMGAGPFADEAAFSAWAVTRLGLSDPQFYAIRAPGGGWIGLASYLRPDPANGVIEVGNLSFSPPLQGTVTATAAMVLMMQQAFALGYRRYEWKCNSRNLPSRRAAQRLGFSYEGIFRQHMVIKGKNRDTAWFSITDADWPALKDAFDLWLSPQNFDAEGGQIRSLSALTAPLLVSRDPALT